MKIIRHIQLKIWPEIIDFIPAIISFERSDPNKENPLDIDFSNITNVYSSSLVIVLIDLLKVIQEKKNRKWLIKVPEGKELMNCLVTLGLFEILKKKMQNQILFWDVTSVINYDQSAITKSFPDFEVISYPIKQFDFDNTANKRELVDEFRDMLFENLGFLQSKYKFKLHKFIQIVVEMAKNAADHTNYNAFFGMDVFIRRNSIELKFVFGDLGEGINRHVRNILLLNTTGSQRAKHLGLVETYHFALTPGETTKKRSKINRGIGMTIIVDLSKDMGLTLSVFDAESRGILSNITNISHSELRRNFYHLGKGKNVGFYYYGEVTHSIK